MQSTKQVTMTQTNPTKPQVLMSWSSGKDSAWALHQLMQNPDVEVVGIFATLNEEQDRVAMHGVRHQLLESQADRLGLPLDVINLPNPCSHDDYGRIMGQFVEQALARGVTHIAFGDLFLEDVRRYREDNLKGTGLEPLFPIWLTPTPELAQTVLDSGLKAIVTCVDSKQIPAEFSGREYNAELLADLPDSADPCGENGEFHTFVYDGPMFSAPIPLERGETIQRDQFFFTDLRPV